jgi:peptidoglycan/xylan/chitin deacetylase (PgdA/CDA1 family)
LEKGIFTISLDTELAWGVVDKPKYLKSNLKYYEKTREVIEKLFVLFTQYEVSATWAVVGHLFLDTCKPVNGQKHPEILRSNYPRYKNDWFAADPCTNFNQDPFWYGRDIVHKIRSCPVIQEIGCHSFSHLIFGDKNTRRETVQSELEACQGLANTLGIKLRSFVFPRNLEGYLDELKKAGFLTFRGSEPLWYRSFPRKVQKVCHMVDQLLSFSPPVIVPKEKEGLVVIPGSMLYLSMDGFRKYIPLKARIKKAGKGLQKAVKEKKIFHLWFHPYDLATAPEKLLQGFEEILKEAASLREKGCLEIRTMCEIAQKYNGEKNKESAE